MSSYDDDGTGQDAAIGADPAGYDVFDSQARIDRIAARLEEQQDGGGFEAEGGFVPAEDAGEFDQPGPYEQERYEAEIAPGQEYDQAQADIASFEEYERAAKAAEVEAFNQDVLRAASKHNLRTPDADELRNMYLTMRGTDLFDQQGVEHVVERLAHDEQRLAREHEQRLATIAGTGKDPVTGEFVDWQAQKAAKEERWRIIWERNGGTWE